MDKKTIFGIPLLLGAIAIILWLFIGGNPKTGNKFEAKVQSPESLKTDSVKAINMYVDFSGSMRGYIDFAGIESGKNTFISTVSSVLDNLESNYKVTSETKCGDKVYAKDPLRLAMQNKAIFNAKTTSIQDMIHDAKLKANNTSISIIVSDMVMSWGVTKIRESKDTLYNLTQIDGLGAAIHSEMKSIKDSGLDVLIAQYYSDYNGNYYCNFTENLKSSDKYKGKKMENRPYYILMIGSANTLKELITKKCLKDYNNIYTSFDIDKCSKLVEFNVFAKDGDKYANLWTIGNIEYPEEIGTIWTTDDLEGSTSTFTFKCNELVIPAYCFNGDCKNLSVKSTPEVILSADIKYPSFSMDVTFRPFNELESQDVELNVICNNNWAKDSSTLNDIEESDMSGKTWGIAKVFEKIDEAFYPSGRNYDQVVGIFNFRIQK